MASQQLATANDFSGHKVLKAGQQIRLWLPPLMHISASATPSLAYPEMITIEASSNTWHRYVHLIEFTKEGDYKVVLALKETYSTNMTGAGRMFETPVLTYIAMRVPISHAMADITSLTDTVEITGNFDSPFYITMANSAVTFKIKKTGSNEDVEMDIGVETIPHFDSVSWPWAANVVALQDSNAVYNNSKAGLTLSHAIPPPSTGKHLVVIDKIAPADSGEWTTVMSLAGVAHLSDRPQIDVDVCQFVSSGQKLQLQVRIGRSGQDHTWNYWNFDVPYDGGHVVTNLVISPHPDGGVAAQAADDDAPPHFIESDTYPPTLLWQPGKIQFKLYNSPHTHVMDLIHNNSLVPQKLIGMVGRTEGVAYRPPIRNFRLLSHDPLAARGQAVVVEAVRLATSPSGVELLTLTHESNGFRLAVTATDVALTFTLRTGINYPEKVKTHPLDLTAKHPGASWSTGEDWLSVGLRLSHTAQGLLLLTLDGYPPVFEVDYDDKAPLTLGWLLDRVKFHTLSSVGSLTGKSSEDERLVYLQGNELTEHLTTETGMYYQRSIDATPELNTPTPNLMTVTDTMLGQRILAGTEIRLRPPALVPFDANATPTSEHQEMIIVRDPAVPDRWFRYMHLFTLIYQDHMVVLALKESHSQTEGGSPLLLSSTYTPMNIPVSYSLFDSLNVSESHPSRGYGHSVPGAGDQVALVRITQGGTKTEFELFDHASTHLGIAEVDIQVTTGFESASWPWGADVQVVDLVLSLPIYSNSKYLSDFRVIPPPSIGQHVVVIDKISLPSHWDDWVTVMVLDAAHSLEQHGGSAVEVKAKINGGLILVELGPNHMRAYPTNSTSGESTYAVNTDLVIYPHHLGGVADRAASETTAQQSLRETYPSTLFWRRGHIQFKLYNSERTRFTDLVQNGSLVPEKPGNAVGYTVNPIGPSRTLASFGPGVGILATDYTLVVDAVKVSGFSHLAEKASPHPLILDSPCLKQDLLTLSNDSGFSLSISITPPTPPQLSYSLTFTLSEGPKVQIRSVPLDLMAKHPGSIWSGEDWLSVAALRLFRTAQGSLLLTYADYPPVFEIDDAPDGDMALDWWPERAMFHVLSPTDIPICMSLKSEWPFFRMGDELTEYLDTEEGKYYQRRISSHATGTTGPTPTALETQIAEIKASLTDLQTQSPPSIIQSGDMHLQTMLQVVNTVKGEVARLSLVVGSEPQAEWKMLTDEELAGLLPTTPVS